jgi:hypothetical protein
LQQFPHLLYPTSILPAIKQRIRSLIFYVQEMKLKLLREFLLTNDLRHFLSKAVVCWSDKNDTERIKLRVRSDRNKYDFNWHMKQMCSTEYLA